MADYSQTVTLSDAKVGDAWIGIGTLGPVTVNSQTPGESLTRVLITFRLGSETFTLDSSGTSPGITISNAATWLCTVPARDVFLPRAGKWDFNIEFFRQGHTTPWTLYKGVITVHNDVD